MTDDALERSIDELYSAPAAEFIPRRKALASELKKQKRIEEATRVLALVKPNAVAAAVNRASAARPEDFAELVASGQRVVAAFRATLSAGQSAVAALSAAQRAQRDRVAALARAIGETMRAEGSSASGDTMTRVEATLLAVSTTGRFGDARWGRLVRELDPPGLDFLMEAAAGVPEAGADGAGAHGAASPSGGAASAAPAADAAPAQPTEDAARKALRRSIDEAERALDKARRAAHVAEAARESASKELDAQREKSLRTRSAIEEASQRLRELEARLATERQREQALDDALRAALAANRERAAEVEELSGQHAALVARLDAQGAAPGKARPRR